MLRSYLCGRGLAFRGVNTVRDLVFVSWKWKQPGFREPYTHEYVNKLHYGLRRHTTIPFRHICVTDDPSHIDTAIDVHQLWKDLNDTPNICGHHLPSCYRRLKLFSPIEQERMGIREGSRIVSIDLDAVIVGNCDDLWRRPERFVGWARPGSRHATVFNGSLWMFTAGDLEELWTTFIPGKSNVEANRAGFMGSDQSWLSYKLINTDYIGGFGPAVKSFPTELRGKLLPSHASIVFFHGRQKPWHAATQHQAPWIRDHWR
jgi:hypothetical protein